jgi:hypothetical protein
MSRFRNLGRQAKVFISEWSQKPLDKFLLPQPKGRKFWN